MAADSPTPKRVAVIGGGISGLTAAWKLAQRPELKISLYESRSELGGVLRTRRQNGFLVEQSADMFTSKDPWALELCRELGIEDQLVGADEARRRAFVVREGRLHPVPEGFVLMRPTQFASMLSTPLLSWRGKMRLFAEPFIGSRKERSDESMQSFVSRRLGKEVFQRIVQPLVGGIYTADPEKLSMAATMPTFAEMERKYGCLLRAPHGKGEREASGARYSAFVAPKEGMQVLPIALENALKQNSQVTLQPGTAVASLQRANDLWQVEINEGGESTRADFDAVILASGARAISRLLPSSASELAGHVRDIPYASAAVVVFGCDLEQIERPVEGFGYVTPMIENRQVLAVSFASHKFPGRAPDGKVLIRVFIGGALQAHLLEHDDEKLIEMATRELREMIGLQGTPALQEVVRWDDAMPQYHVGHVEKVDQIERLEQQQPNLALAGNAFRGVGVPYCVRSGTTAAERILKQIETESLDR